MKGTKCYFGWFKSTGPRLVGSEASLIIWRPFKTTFFELFQPRTGLETIFEGV